MPISKERLEQIKQIRDEDIDFSDIPELDEEWFKNARLVMPPNYPSKQSITMRLDQDIIEWFKSDGAGHLTRMNAVLRAYMLAHRDED